MKAVSDGLETDNWAAVKKIADDDKQAFDDAKLAYEKGLEVETNQDAIVNKLDEILTSIGEKKAAIDTLLNEEDTGLVALHTAAEETKDAKEGLFTDYEEWYNAQKIKADGTKAIADEKYEDIEVSREMANTATENLATKITAARD